MPASFKVRGLDELDKAFKGMEKGVHKEFRDNIKQIVEPVAVDARRLASPFGFRTVAGLKAGARVGVGVVRQHQKKTTGDHPNFAGKLIGEVLNPALQMNEDRVLEGIEGLIDKVADREGF